MWKCTIKGVGQNNGKKVYINRSFDADKNKNKTVYELALAELVKRKDMGRSFVGSKLSLICPNMTTQICVEEHYNILTLVSEYRSFLAEAKRMRK